MLHVVYYDLSKNNRFIFRYFNIIDHRYLGKKWKITIMNDYVVEIEYCRQCRWLLRAAWMAQELLMTFDEDLSAVSLKPGTGGVFVVRLNGQVLFSRQSAERFPEAKEIKQLIRDVIDPERSLGHSDGHRAWRHACYVVGFLGLSKN